MTRVFAARPAPVQALRGVDLDITPGAFTAILGASGCGKTTLLRLLAGFDRPSSGEIFLDGRMVAGPGVFLRPEQRRVGVVAQEGALFPHLDVAANVAYGLPGGLRGRRARRERVGQMLELVGLPGHDRRRPDELSGGQQQRVALARALAPEPAVLLLDEPFSALDAALRVELREEVKDVLRRIDATTILVTHDQSEALSLADEVVMMREGRIVQSGSPWQVYANPVDRSAASFLGESVELPCRICGADGELLRVDCALGTLDVQRSAIFDEGGANLLVLRPEQLVLGQGGIPATVARTSFFGHDGLVRVELTDGTPLLVRLDGREMPAVGSRVTVRLLEAAATAAPTAHAASISV